MPRGTKGAQFLRHVAHFGLILSAHLKRSRAFLRSPWPREGGDQGSSWRLGGDQMRLEGDTM